MQMGFGLVIGAVIGAGVGFLVVMLVLAFKHGASKARATSVFPKETAPKNQAKSATAIKPASNTRVIPKAAVASDNESLFMESLAAKENKLGKAVHEVRDLVHKVADIVVRTNDASGEAAKAFNLAKVNLDALDVNDSENLLAAHAVLLHEINSVISTNETLQSELETARTGIAEQRRQIEELRNAVRIDSLTQLPNRAAFDERINEFIKRLERTNEAFSLLLIDIDLFKKINDTYGHFNGDRILKGIAHKIKDNVRGNDFPARYGGEEFAVILPATGKHTAEAVAERMRQDIAKANFKLDDNDIKITISGGIAECQKAMTVETLIKKADKALYRSKSEGRNRISLAEEQL